MERSAVKDHKYREHFPDINARLVARTISLLRKRGVKQFCLCPGKRNAPFVIALENSEDCFFWPEERSAAFFALGRSRATERPVAVVTTSGTAAAELLPAVIEAHYARVPLIVVTADRPKRFRGTGAPQAIDQVGLFSPYVSAAFDIEEVSNFDLSTWCGTTPLHLNICLDEPLNTPCEAPSVQEELFELPQPSAFSTSLLDAFFQKVSSPLVVVGALSLNEREAATRFLLELNAPVLLEAPSGLREEKRLRGVQLHWKENIIGKMRAKGYQVDGVLRLGDVPTHRLWRDLSESEQELPVLSLSHKPFSGLPKCAHRSHLVAPLDLLFSKYSLDRRYAIPSGWQEDEALYREKLEQLFARFPHAEPSLVFNLSKKLSSQTRIYLGNSSPIREWELAATVITEHRDLFVSRGANGIDGQVSTFFGLCEVQKDNWALIGDLTLLYDLAAFWIAPKLEGILANIVVLNNGGGKIFSRHFKQKQFQNQHSLDFSHLAALFGIEYVLWKEVPEKITSKGVRLIEIVPEQNETANFWEALDELSGY